MARIVIPAIEVDLPIYHGTSETVLNKGVGHLFGTALPVGGAGTRSTLTAHSGLADAVLFTFLERLKPGDVFHIEVYGERLSYRVFEIKQVEPHDTQTIAPVPGRDLVTLVTCTPIGINSHRLIVTGERIATIVDEDHPVPAEIDLPGFPSWVVILGVSLLLVIAYAALGGGKGARHNAYAGDPKLSAVSEDELGTQLRYPFGAIETGTETG